MDDSSRHGETVTENVLDLLCNSMNGIEVELANSKERNRQLYSKLRPLRLQIEALKVWGNAMEELVPKPPEPNCRCHINPPCTDCVDWSEIREVKKAWADAKKFYNEEDIQL